MYLMARSGIRYLSAIIIIKLIVITYLNQNESVY